ncbi:MAG: hypothetical protein ABDH32_05945 [Candidatus Caldarchaeales archaeon]
MITFVEIIALTWRFGGKNGIILWLTNPNQSNPSKDVLMYSKIQ